MRNGVVLFEDESELVTASVTAQRAHENCDYVRTLLARKQPEFARALASAEQGLACKGSCLPERFAAARTRQQAEVCP